MKYVVLAGVIGFVIFFFTSNAMSKTSAIENIVMGEVFLNKNKVNPDVLLTASGLQYQILQKGQGNVHPSVNTTVKAHYHGTLLDGTVFDSSVERGKPISFRLNQVISGWTEGLQLMVVGDKFKFFVSSELGYGNRDTGEISAGSLLIFEVELLEIK